MILGRITMYKIEWLIGTMPNTIVTTECDARFTLENVKENIRFMLRGRKAELARAIGYRVVNDRGVVVHDAYV